MLGTSFVVLVVLSSRSIIMLTKREMVVLKLFLIFSRSSLCSDIKSNSTFICSTHLYVVKQHLIS